MPLNSSSSPLEKLQILAGAARYDASCASCGGAKQRGNSRTGNSTWGICHSWSADGRCISLLKLLLTNHCLYDCAYCINRRSNDQPRLAFTPQEIADLTLQFYRRNYIEGLFLSTGVWRHRDYTMEQLVATVRLLREEHDFPGYIHLKVIPGADPLLVEQAGRYADRLSVNIELPSAASLEQIAPDKNRMDILTPMRQIDHLLQEQKEGTKARKKPAPFAPGGQSTQMIVGASPESDRQIINLSEHLYQSMRLKRVYYSALVPVSGDSRLPTLPGGPPLLREHRLYQADWLLRFYGFRAEEILTEDAPNFDLRFDPKMTWALRHRDFFPVEINRAPYEVLLRVPGLGVRSAQRIIRCRRAGPLTLDDLPKIGLVLKRARYFITVNGRYFGERDPQAADLQELLLEPELERLVAGQQLQLFAAGDLAAQLTASTLSGEL